jgi:hypothetical protein
MNHFPGHQQALVKNNLCVAVLSFSEHDELLMNETFNKFEYDLVLNLCEIQKDASIGTSWDGLNFNIKLFESWTLGEDLKWHAPTPKPEGDFFWNEETSSWVQDTLDTAV